MMRRLLAIPLLAGCQALTPDALSGGLTDVLDLSFTHTRARLSPSEIAVEWVDAERGGLVAVRVSADWTGTLSTPGALPVTFVGVAEALDVLLPVPVDGQLQLDLFAPHDDGEATGSFTAEVPTAPNATLALEGRFDTTVEVLHAP